MSSLRRALAACTLLGASALTHAANVIDQVQFSCTDGLSLDGTSALRLNCQGDFGVSGVNGQGLIEADESITLWAAGTLTLLDVILRAPVIQINSAQPTLPDASGPLNVTTGELKVLDGATVQLGASPVPEPATGVLGWVGLGGLLLGARRRRSARR